MASYKASIFKGACNRCALAPQGLEAHSPGSRAIRSNFVRKNRSHRGRRKISPPAASSSPRGSGSFRKISSQAKICELGLSAPAGVSGIHRREILAKPI
jgi:hypothetical protein